MSKNLFLCALILAAIAASIMFLFTGACSKNDSEGGRIANDSDDDDDDIDPVEIPILFDIDDGEWSEEALPDSSSSDARPKLESVDGPDYIINGGSGSYTLKFSDPQGAASVTHMYVGLHESRGYYRVPLTQQEEGVSSHLITLHADYERAIFSLDFAVEEEDGNVSNYVNVQSAVIKTGTGDIKVSLSFDQEVDLDLHVVDPSGEEIYFGNRISASGGELDLDSNAACSIDHYNNENIYWKKDTAPEGDYIVRVDYWEACVNDPVNYIVTIILGEDDVTMYQGSFVSTDADGGGEGSGRLITTFTYTRD
jgi:hypothetical protein